MTSQFVGSWRLVKNENLSSFMEFYGYSWLKRKAAAIAKVTVTFRPSDDVPNKGLIRELNSTFLSGVEEFSFDGKFHENPEGLEKKHKLKDDNIISMVKRPENGAEWSEMLSVKGSNLIVKRDWYDGKNHSCTQIFEKI